jgi:hypothetical protein
MNDDLNETNQRSGDHSAHFLYTLSTVDFFQNGDYHWIFIVVGEEVNDIVIFVLKYQPEVRSEDKKFSIRNRKSNEMFLDLVRL